MLTVKPYAVAQDLRREYDANDWDGSDDLQTLANARYAVVVERDGGESWIRAANTVQDVAGIALGCYAGTEGYDEWIGGVFAIADGSPVSFGLSISVAVELDGQTATAKG